MTIENLLSCAPVGVNRLRQTIEAKKIINNIIIREKNVIDYEVPSDVWQKLLENDVFKAQWIALASNRSEKQALKKQADREKMFAEMQAGITFAKQAGL